MGVIESALLMHFDINYNFDSNTILGFEILQISWAYDEIHGNYKYEDDKYYILEDEDDEHYDQEFLKSISIRNQVKEKFNTHIDLNLDYSSEYDKAMAEVFGS